MHAQPAPVHSRIVKLYPVGTHMVLIPDRCCRLRKNPIYRMHAQYISPWLGPCPLSWIVEILEFGRNLAFSPAFKYRPDTKFRPESHHVLLDRETGTKIVVSCPGMQIRFGP